MLHKFREKCSAIPQRLYFSTLLSLSNTPKPQFSLFPSLETLLSASILVYEAFTHLLAKVAHHLWCHSAEALTSGTDGDHFQTLLMT